MTKEQHARAREFAVAMAEGGWERMTQQRRGKLACVVDCFFEPYFPDDLQELPLIRAYDQTDQDPNADRWSRKTYVCDLLSEYVQKWTPENVWKRNGGEDGKFASCITACVRAGMDVAAEPSAGVIGFTVGDVRRMFGGEIPEWVDDAYEKQLAGASGDEGIWL